MDPNLIHLDWERTFDALMIVIVLAFLVERALAVLFETEFFIRHVDRPGIKAIIAAVVSIAVCFVWKFDAVSMVLLKAELTQFLVSINEIEGRAGLDFFHELPNATENRLERSAATELWPLPVAPN